MRKLFINCDEATTICTKNQYKEASFIEKIQLGIHLLRCKICGLYSKQNTKLTEVCNKHLNKSKCEHLLTEKDKERIKEKLAEADK
tara:strand:- start:203505 stop:203762 length:258 start_codon:yes stop_codon:yes gene_type:complete